MLQCPKCGRHFASDVRTCPEDGTPLRADATVPGEAVSDSLVGRVLDDKYRLDGRLGEGGMGTVYRATHLLIDRPVAVKVLNSRLLADDATMERFRREARAAGRLRHTNAVAVTDFGETRDGVVYIVMELLEGVTLREVLAHEAPLDPALAVSLMLQAAAAVAAAHEAGIIHRDLKPGNIFLVEREHAPHLVKVLDFGIAKLAADATDGGNPITLTGTGVMIGTPRYMSPEQCDGGALTPASDVYSLGVILYEMLTGVPPFSGATPLAIALKHSSEAPRRPTTLVESIPPALEEVVLHALEKKPEERPPDASAFRRELYAVAERLGLQHAAGFSAPTLETLRDAGTETPSGRLIIDIERLRQTRAATAPMPTDEVAALDTSESAAAQTGGKPAPAQATEPPAPPASSTASASSSSTASAPPASSAAPIASASPASPSSTSAASSTPASSSTSAPATAAASASSIAPAAPASSVAPASAASQTEASPVSSSVEASASAPSAAAASSSAASGSRLRIPVRREGRAGRGWLGRRPALVAALAGLVVLALVVAFVSWRSAGRRSGEAAATNEGEETIGRTLSSADIAPRVALKQNEPRSAAEFYERGAYYFSSRNYDAAIRDYRRALELQPDFPAAHNRLGRALMMKSQFGAAADEFRRAVEQKNGRYPAASYNLGYALQLQGNMAEALAAYREAINNRDGNYPDAFYQIGIIHLNQRRDAEAAEALRRAIEQNNGRDPDAQFGLGVALARQKDYAGAESAFRDAIEGRGGDFADAHFNLALVYQNTNRFDEAIGEFETYLRQQPSGENRRLAENSIRELRRRAPRERQEPPSDEREQPPQ